MKSSLFLATCILMTASFTAHAKPEEGNILSDLKDRINKPAPKPAPKPTTPAKPAPKPTTPVAKPAPKPEPKPEPSYCSTIDINDSEKFPLKAPVFNPYTESEDVGYNRVRALAKEVFEERKIKLINEKMDDIATFCPNYNKFDRLGKESFFGHLLANIARYESHYAEGDSMKENNGNVSRGLLGISYGSLSTGYKKAGCDVILKDLDLADGKSNVQCGLGIISDNVVTHKVLALDKTKGASRYWSTLRSPYKVCLSTYKRVVTVGFKEVIIEGLKVKMPSCFKKIE